MNPRHCPLCNALPSHYVEVWTGRTIEFDADENGVPGSVGALGEGTPTHVIAVCRECRHRWKLRGVNQITDLTTEVSP